MGLAYLFISHDLRMVRQMSHEVAVMYLGGIVERGDPDRLFAAPAHPYTRHCLGDSRGAPEGPATADPEGAAQSGRCAAGCAFHERCPIAVARCRAETPPLRPMADGRHVACHLAPGSADA